MMPIQAPKNLYRGVNPHLNSFLQRKGTRANPSQFEGFHSIYVGGIRSYLNRHLPPNYKAVSEQSMQVTSRIGEDNPKPDVAIVRKRLSTTSAQMSAVAEPTWEEELIVELEPEEQMMAVVIQELEQDRSEKIVARLELISPANKPGGSYHDQYRVRQSECRRDQIPLVEIDFLHERKPVIPTIPLYPVDSDSKAYYIALTDPRPEQAKRKTYGFSVGESLPTISIPLAGTEIVVTNFDEIYQSCFEIERMGLGLDYSLLPERFETYSADDQQRIKTRMAEIAQEYGEQSS